MNQTVTTAGIVQLPDHDWTDPVPTPDCPTCAGAAAARTAAHRTGDRSAVTDHNITIHTHPH
ncbi:hypothetical protein ACN20G_34920 (plasmid) [Streptomyces sp. BI20]|uniref:hypothetical protein n=1 Tax=Streptomyces sp. BI20 TaxID=3403460 RepID=UPI003C793E9F